MSFSATPWLSFSLTQSNPNWIYYTTFLLWNKVPLVKFNSCDFTGTSNMPVEASNWYKLESCTTHFKFQRLKLAAWILSILYFSINFALGSPIYSHLGHWCFVTFLLTRHICLVPFLQFLQNCLDLLQAINVKMQRVTKSALSLLVIIYLKKVKPTISQISLL